MKLWSDSMDADVTQKIGQFFSTYPLRRYPKNHLLLFPRDKAEHVYYLVSGRVCQYDISYKGEEIIVNTFKHPAFFPMALAMTVAENRFFYKTESPTELRAAPVEEVIRFLKSDPAVMYDLLSRVYGGVEVVLGRMKHLMAGTALSRLMYELVAEYRRFGGMENGKAYIEVSEVRIAARTGLSRETVNRELRLLKDKGLISVESHRIWLEDVPTLEVMLEALV